MCNHDVMQVIKMEAVLPNRNIEKEVFSVGGGALVWTAGGAEGASTTGGVEFKQIILSKIQLFTPSEDSLKRKNHVTYFFS